MKSTAKPRKWGNSLGITIPKEIIEEEGITLEDELIIDIKKKSDIKAIRSLFKIKKPTQKIKDELREGWKKNEIFL